MIPQIQSTLSTLERYQGREAEYEKEVLGGQQGYYDDLCLAKFLEGVCLRYVVYPEENTIPEELSTSDEMTGKEAMQEMARKAGEAFRDVFEYGPKVELDHYIVYHAREFFSPSLPSICFCSV